MGKCLFLRKGETHTAPISGILASDLAVGSIVKLNENGTAVEYMVVHQGLPSSMYDASCNGTWLLRKDCYSRSAWHSSDSNSYIGSTIHSYLNNTFLNVFDEELKSIIKKVEVPYYYKGSIMSVSCSAFLLSGYEIGFNQSVSPVFPIDGAILSYFVSGDTSSARNKRICKYNGSTIAWWTRSADTSNSGRAWGVTILGGSSVDQCSNPLGIRPALILPSNALFDKNTLILKGVA